MGGETPKPKHWLLRWLTENKAGLARAAAMGFTVGALDELTGLAAALGAPRGETLRDSYHTAREQYDEKRAETEQAYLDYRKEHPTASTAAEIAGGIGSFLATPLASLPIAGTAGRVATAAAYGGGFGALGGAMYAPPGERAKGAAIGAAVGAPTAAVFPAASRLTRGAVQKTIEGANMAGGPVAARILAAPYAQEPGKPPAGEPLDPAAVRRIHESLGLPPPAAPPTADQVLRRLGLRPSDTPPQPGIRAAGPSPQEEAAGFFLNPLAPIGMAGQMASAPLDLALSSPLALGDFLSGHPVRGAITFGLAALPFAIPRGGGEYIMGPALRVNGKVYRGTHGQAHSHVLAQVEEDLVKAARARGVPERHVYDDYYAALQRVSADDEGFVTSTGRYVNRKEGMELAVRSGQLPGDPTDIKRRYRLIGKKGGYPDDLHAHETAAPPLSARLLDSTRQHGGATVDAAGKPTRATGFAVADPEYTHIVRDPSSPDELAKLDEWLQSPDVQARLQQPGAHYGTWLNPKTGRLEVNISDVLPDEQAARQLGQQRHQLALGRLDNGKYLGDVELPTPRGNDAVIGLAARYRRARGYTRLPEAQKNEEAGRHMASVYEGLKSAPDDPEVRRAYRAMADEVRAQYDDIRDAGYEIEFVDADPYKNSAEMMADLRDNRRLRVLKTNADSKHPLLSNEENDMFRAVHDFFGHASGGHQFGPLGEERAFREHASMFSPTARRAMATETRGQNSWVNYGPNAHLPPAQRPFAQQKAALWPEDLLGDVNDFTPPPARGGLGRATADSIAHLAPRLGELPGTDPFRVGMIHAPTSHPLLDPFRGGDALIGEVPSIARMERGLPPLFETPDVLRPDAPDVLDPPQVDIPRAEPRNPRLYEQTRERMRKAIRSAAWRDDIERGIEMGMVPWYDTRRIEQSAIDALGLEEGRAAFRQWSLMMGPTSSSTPPALNMRQAGAAYTLGPERIAEMAARGEPLPSGWGAIYPKQVIQDLDLALREGLGGPEQANKLRSYIENIRRNWRPYTLDRHEGRRIMQMLDAPRFSASGKTERTLTPLAYRAAEEQMQELAGEMAGLLGAREGLDPTAPAQAARWGGGAEHTGVRGSKAGRFPTLDDLFNRAVYRTAVRTGTDPQTALRRFWRRQAPLFGVTGLLGAAAANTEPR